MVQSLKKFGCLCAIRFSKPFANHFRPNIMIFRTFPSTFISNILYFPLSAIFCLSLSISISCEFEYYDNNISVRQNLWTHFHPKIAQKQLHVHDKEWKHVQLIKLKQQLKSIWFFLISDVYFSQVLACTDRWKLTTEQKWNIKLLMPFL